MKREAAISLSIVALSLAFFLPKGVQALSPGSSPSAQSAISTAGQKKKPSRWCPRKPCF